MRTRNGALRIEARRLPIIDITYVGDPQIDDMRDAFVEYARLAERGEPLLWLVDMREFDPVRVGAAHRQAVAEIFREHEAVLRPVSIAEARVITNPLTRGVVTAFDWLTGANKWPCAQFPNVDEAEAWLRARLARAQFE